jgi:hypothetical protein
MKNDLKKLILPHLVTQNMPLFSFPLKYFLKKILTINHHQTAAIIQKISLTTINQLPDFIVLNIKNTPKIITATTSGHTEIYIFILSLEIFFEEKTY